MVEYDPLTGQPIGGNAPKKEIETSQGVQSLYQEVLFTLYDRVMEIPSPRLQRMLKRNFDEAPDASKIPTKAEPLLQQWQKFLEDADVKDPKRYDAEGLIVTTAFLTNLSHFKHWNPPEIATQIAILYQKACKVASFEREIYDLKYRIETFPPFFDDKKKQKEKDALRKKRDALLGSKAYLQALAEEEEVKKELYRYFGLSVYIPNFLTVEKEDLPQPEIEEEPLQSPEEKEAPTLPEEVLAELNEASLSLENHGRKQEETKDAATSLAELEEFFK